MGVKVEPTTPLVAELGRKHPAPTQPQDRKSGTQLSFRQARRAHASSACHIAPHLHQTTFRPWCYSRVVRQHERHPATRQNGRMLPQEAAPGFAMNHPRVDFGFSSKLLLSQQLR
ncbi:uncharacterized protein TrAtP1_005569 [Trichoderma atroviride]|uniref:uncharacterized protein n=1 Tax=Hypocrea atroviridis TaxID=63577 RepID=UPI00332D1B0A|nr:hypothetical protein TrAtP1_005569 [Trichoderma atroviride]